MNKYINEKRKAKHAGQNLIYRQEKLSRQSEFEEDSSLKEKKKILFDLPSPVYYITFYKFNIFMQKMFKIFTISIIDNKIIYFWVEGRREQ